MLIPQFADKEAKLRQTVHGIFHDPTGEVLDSYQDKFSESKELDDKAGNKTKSHRPAWALTEKTVQAPDNEPLMGDEEELLAFASGLDIDRYLGDMEVRTMMERVKRRIKELEREVSQDEKRETEQTQRAIKRAGDSQGPEDSDEDDGEEDGGDETLQAAKDLLYSRAATKDVPSLRAVHSTQSAAALLKAARDKGRGTSQVTNEPLIAIQSDCDGTRLEAKNDISKLPYMHRNPAV